MSLQLQRLAQPALEPAVFLVDVGGIIRGVAETHGTAVPWLAIVAAANRSNRRTLWVVAPTAANGAPASELDAAEQLLRGAVSTASILRSRQSLQGLLLALPEYIEYPRISVVSADLEEHFYEQAPLDRFVSEIIDLVTGKAWTPPRGEREFGLGKVLPQLVASTGSARGLPPQVSFAAEQRYRDAILGALERGEEPEHAQLPERVKTELATNRSKIKDQTNVLEGRETRDPKAWFHLRLFLRGGTYCAPEGTAYIVAGTEEIGGRRRFTEARVLEGAAYSKAIGHGKTIRLLKRVRAQRWFVPRALDLLAACVDNGVGLPARVADPALGAFVLDPDCPARLESICPWLHTLSRQDRAWLADLGRERPGPACAQTVLDALGELDRMLAARLAIEDLSNLFEEDLATTLPVLAKIERGGARIHVPRFFGSWQKLRAALDARTQRLTKQVGHLSTFNLATAPLKIVGEQFRRSGRVPWQIDHPSLAGKSLVARLAHHGVAEARAVAHLRSISSKTGLLYWLAAVQSASTQALRGSHVPQRTGRFGYQRHPLQNIPKDRAGARALRSGLAAPIGYVLLRADWNAFEARLIAELSGDPMLVVAATQKDLHAAVASSLGVKRDEAKAMLYAMLYGQGGREFFRANPNLTWADAQQLHTLAKKSLAVAMRYLDQQEAKLRSGSWLTTPGGFRRRPYRDTQARNFVVQGFGADCMRWVLRKLDLELASYGARVVHQQHDEVFVVAVAAQVAVVEPVVRRVMEVELVSSSQLFQRNIRMPVGIKLSRAW